MTIEATTTHPALRSLAQLANIAALSDGWFDGEGRRPPLATVQFSGELLIALSTTELPQPRLYPLPDGGIQFEWSTSERQISIEVETGPHAQYWSYDPRRDLELADLSMTDVASVVERLLEDLDGQS